MKNLLLNAIAVAALLACSPSAAPEIEPTDVVQTTCQEPQYAEMDFWIGDWAINWQTAEGETQQGTNTITKFPFANCVVTEQFNGGPDFPLRGMSVSTYSKPHKMWRQTWVDNNGSYFSLYGGPQDDGTFVLDMERLGDKGPYSRMVFEDITDDSLVWRWQGKAAAADAWADQWVINYVKPR